MRLAARVLFPGTGRVAFAPLMDLVCLLMDLLGKKFLSRGLWPFLTLTPLRQFVRQLSFRVRRPAFSKTDFEDTLSLRAVFVIVLTTNLIDQLMFSVARFVAQSSWADLKCIAAGNAVP